MPGPNSRNRSRRAAFAQAANKHESKAMRRIAATLARRVAVFEKDSATNTKIAATLNRPGSQNRKKR